LKERVINFKTHIALGVVAAVVIFFSSAYLLIKVMPSGQIQWVLATVLPPSLAWYAIALVNKFLPVRCAQCGGAAYRERGARICYACRSCKHVEDTGWKIGSGSGSGDS
jgi:hypothetical protein